MKQTTSTWGFHWGARGTKLHPKHSELAQFHEALNRYLTFFDAELATQGLDLDTDTFNECIDHYGWEMLHALEEVGLSVQPTAKKVLTNRHR